ncbi:hypothetical protein NQD34_015494 [Periophthalmus magnuspinnatus]|nr:hypothetical protein NQD34_015494 [Periophthalmus magnuspinnatus]
MKSLRMFLQQRKLEIHTLMSLMKRNFTVLHKHQNHSLQKVRLKITTILNLHHQSRGALSRQNQRNSQTSITKTRMRRRKRKRLVLQNKQLQSRLSPLLRAVDLLLVQFNQGAKNRMIPMQIMQT